MQERDHYKSAKDIGNHEGTRSQHFRCSRQRKQIVQVNSIDIIVLNKFDDSIVEKSSMHSSLSLLVARGSWYQVQGSGFSDRSKHGRGSFCYFDTTKNSRSSFLQSVENGAENKRIRQQNPWVVLQIQVCRGICDFNICWKLSRSRLYFLIRNVLVLKY